MQQSFVSTFGVEFEFVFAFHQDRLKEVLNSAVPEAKPSLIKAAHKGIHEKFLFSSDSRNATAGRKLWPSWVFKVDESTGNEQDFLKIMQYARPYPVRSCPEVGALGDEWKHKRVYFRDYFLEHLIIANRILREQNLEATVIGCMVDHFPWKACTADASWPEEKAWAYTGKDKTLYSKWILTNDSSVVGATKGELRSGTRTPINEKNQQDWDSHSLELISRVFDLAEINGACKEIGTYLSAFMPQLPPTSSKNDAQWAMLDSIFAGTHVHIGLDWKTGAEVNTHQRFIRHLIFIIMSQEELISQLHPRRRRGINEKWSPINPVFPPPKTNEEVVERVLRERREEETRVSEVKEKFVSQICLGSNYAYFAKTHLKQDPALLGQHNLARAVFDKLNHYRTTEALLRDFQPAKGTQAERHLLVNLSNLREMVNQGKYLDLDHEVNARLKPTIEFRQHACILNAEEVKHWVKFCQAIVQLAEFRARQPAPDLDCPTWELELRKYPESCNDIGTLLGPDMLNLEPSEVTYWQNRYALYRDEEKIELQNRVRRRADRIRNKRKYGMDVDEAERQQLRAAHDDLVSESDTHLPTDYKTLSMPSREEYFALDTDQLKRIAQHRDSIGERQMKRQRKEDYVNFIQKLDRRGEYGDGTRMP